MPRITLADIQTAADAKHGPLVIELPDGEASLLAPLRLSKEKRKRLTALEQNATEGGEDELIAETIRIAAATPGDAKRILAATGGDLAVLSELLEQWTAGGQLGEASPSGS